jgi:hypothetical protein
MSFRARESQETHLDARLQVMQLLSWFLSDHTCLSPRYTRHERFHVLKPIAFFAGDMFHQSWQERSSAPCRNSSFRALVSSILVTVLKRLVEVQANINFSPFLEKQTGRNAWVELLPHILSCVRHALISVFLESTANVVP